MNLDSDETVKLQVYKGLRDGMQEVACKVLHQEDELQEQEFALEMKLQKYLSYDNNLIQFLGATHLNGRPMLVVSTPHLFKTTVRELRFLLVINIEGKLISLDASTFF